jgi:uncharacterized glyoxalase superfamily protein PhnB
MSHPIPNGFQAVTPHLVIDGASDAIAFYKRAFGAEEICCVECPGKDGQPRVGHGAIRIGSSIIFLADECPEAGAFAPKGSSPVTIHLYVDDADATFSQAVEAGARAVMHPADRLWGDRYGKLVDPFGHYWSIAHHVEDVSHEQIQERMAALFAAQPETKPA